MKRVLYIVCMLLANIGIVAHAVVPHHHRCELLTAVVHLLDEGECSRHVDTEEAPVHHHHSDKPGECLIDGSYTAPRVQNDEYSLVPESPTHDSAFPFAAVCIDFSYKVRYCPQQQSFRFRPYAINAFPDYVAACIGLRAPPLA